MVDVGRRRNQASQRASAPRPVRGVRRPTGCPPLRARASLDPLDALVIADVASYPGVVIPCRPIGVVLVSQKGRTGKRERNDRLVVIPSAAQQLRDLIDPRSLPARMREEIEQFFLSSTFFTQRDARIQGWRERGTRKSWCAAPSSTPPRGDLAGVSTTLRFVAVTEWPLEWSKLARQMKGPECNGGKAS